MEAPIRVLLVEDNDVFRESMSFLLGTHEGIDVVGSVALGETAAKATVELGADVVVIDYRLPDIDGGEVAREVREVRPAVSVIFLSASVGRDEQEAARMAGAPLVGKDARVDALVEAVREVAGGSA